MWLASLNRAQQQSCVSESLGKIHRGTAILQEFFYPVFMDDTHVSNSLGKAHHTKFKEAVVS